MKFKKIITSILLCLLLLFILTGCKKSSNNNSKLTGNSIKKTLAEENVNTDELMELFEENILNNKTIQNITEELIDIIQNKTNISLKNITNVSLKNITNISLDNVSNIIDDITDEISKRRNSGGGSAIINYYGKLTIIINITNDNGGNAIQSDFNITVDDVSYLSGNQISILENKNVNISIETPSGYIYTNITGDIKCPNLLNMNLSLNRNDNIICYIDANDIAPRLTLFKEVINDNLGNNVPNDFILSVTSLYSTATGSIKNTTYTTSSTTIILDANTNIFLNETQLNNYGFKEITGNIKCPSNLLENFTLNEGENISCTIVNDDIYVPLYLTIIKQVNNNAGTHIPSDFRLHLWNNSIEINNSPFYGSATGTIFELSSGTYQLTEDPFTGYNLIDVSCDPAYQSGTATISFTSGNNVTCIVTNQEI